MVGQQESGNSLNQRVSNYLRDKPVEYAHEESEAEALDAIFDTLLKAEEDLRDAQERIDLFKWEIAKIKS
jgi:hypothetical protein